MTAVRPAARFGDLELDGNKILNFQEKPQLKRAGLMEVSLCVNQNFSIY